MGEGPGGGWRFDSPGSILARGGGCGISHRVPPAGPGRAGATATVRTTAARAPACQH